MNDKRKLLFALTIVILVLMFGVVFIRESMKNKSSSSDALVVQPAKTQDDYANWSLFRNGYALPVPPEWKNTSDNGGVAILEPGKAIGSMQEISIAILSDKNAPQGQQFTTQKELDEWSAVNGKVQGDIQKLKNITMDETPGVMLIDTTGEKNKWVVMAWTRKDNVNIQIRFTGSGTYGDQDKKAVDYIISHFTLTAPPMTGKEGKE